LQKIQNSDNPFLAAEITDQWVEERHYSTQDGHQALNEFIAARKETLAFLDGTGVDWSRTARHSIFGPTNLQEVVNFIAGHDRGHIQQIWKIVRAGRG
jgi:hypothetical protein